MIINVEQDFDQIKKLFSLLSYFYILQQKDMALRSIELVILTINIKKYITTLTIININEAELNYECDNECRTRF